MAEPPVPKLTLFFPDDFGDKAWSGTTFALEAPQKERGEWVIGRSAACDLTIRIREVSTRHACIFYSYARDRWTICDLDSTNGTYHNGRKLVVGEAVDLKLRDRITLGPRGKIQIVEDEQDTISPDDTGASKVSSGVVLPAPAPAPASKTPWDSLYLGTQWVISGQTTAGKIYRLIVAAAGALLFMFVVDWLSK